MRLIKSIARTATSCLLLAGVADAQDSSCKNIPGDDGWPSQTEWARLNETIEGRLIATVPQGSVCHPEPYQNFDETACDALRETWNVSTTFELKPAEIMNPFFLNQSCDPFTPKDKSCSLGNYASYSIKVTCSSDVVAGIKFAKDKDIRLVVKNTGHDYMGKSTGKGSLSLWTHNLKNIDIISGYTSPDYNGPAVRIGAGVIVGELYEALSEQGYRAVGGTCGSVGVAGGYAAGGGHSVLNGLYGMAADNVLEWELVTADGQRVVATPSNEYADLYWAMSGGGPGVWGVVLSMTYKIYPEDKVGGAKLAFNSSSVDADTYWRAIEAWYSWLPSYVDGFNGGNSVAYLVSAKALTAASFTVPGGDASTVDELIRPLLEELDGLGVPYAYTSRCLPSFYEHFAADFGPLPYGPYPTSTLFSNRLFPRAVVEDPSSNAALVEGIRNITAYQDGYFFLSCVSVHVKDAEHPPNAVLPAFRNTIGICSITGYWDLTAPLSEMLDHKEYLANIANPALEAVTPDSGSYLNEVDSWYIGDWKQEFYGGNYDRLMGIKSKYDPENFFYAYTGVGSDSWIADDEAQLCRA